MLYFPSLLCYNTDMEKMMNDLLSNAETVTISRAEYDKLLSEVERLERQNEYYLELLLQRGRRLYGKSSEKADEIVMEQLSFLYDEAEVTDCKSLVEKPAETKVKSYTRKHRSGSIDDVITSETPVEVIEHRLSEEERLCPICGSEMVEIGKESRRTLVVIPAQHYVREDVYYTYACKICEKESEEALIVKTPREPAVITGSYASPEIIAYLMTQKFAMHSPLYRMEQEFNRQGLKLSRQTMSNWLLQASDAWLKPIYDCLHKQLLKEEVLHADETTLEVLREQGKSAGSKSYMWLYRTSRDAEMPIVLYEYKPNRKAANAETFLDGFEGWLHADGYQGYHRLNGKIRVVGCWAHARRKFENALKALSKDEQKNAHAAVGVAYCTELFRLEQKFAEMTAEDRYKKRQEEEKPVLDAIFAWAYELQPKTAPKSALGRALHYLLEQRPYLLRYLEDGRLELSNNRAERSIKPFVMGRKNWLFSNTPGGAQSSSVIFSLIETAKENGLNPYSYLLHILREAPKLSRTSSDWALNFTPDKIPNSCRIPKSE